MELMPVRTWKLEFARGADAERHREIVLRHQEDLRLKREKDKKTEKDREDRMDALEDLAFAVMASQPEIDAYLVTTAHYQEATYEAIVQNEQLLTAIRREKQTMLEQAHVLADGRRVFESEDGIRGFDEFGEELDPSEIDADEIADWRPKHESFQALKEEEAKLVEEKAELLEYQGKVDEARERLEAGDISQKEFEAMQQDLADDMPDRVRENLPDEFKPAMPEQESDLVVEAAPAGG